MRPSTIAAIMALGLLGHAIPADAQPAPPHAWLFGSWTGGLFPAPRGLSAQACLSQPVVVFTRDLVLRATLTDQLYTQRLVETARTTGSVTEFRFSPAPSTGGGLLGTAAPAAAGFGCADPNTLVVQRSTDNEVTFPGCPEFAYPLLRCPAR